MIVKTAVKVNLTLLLMNVCKAVFLPKLFSL